MIKMMNGNVLLEHTPQEKGKEDNGFFVPNKDKFEWLTVVVAENYNEGDKLLVPKQRIIGAEITIESKIYISVHESVVIAQE